MVPRMGRRATECTTKAERVIGELADPERGSALLPMEEVIENETLIQCVPIRLRSSGLGSRGECRDLVARPKLYAPAGCVLSKPRQLYRRSLLARERIWLQTKPAIPDRPSNDRPQSGRRARPSPRS